MNTTLVESVLGQLEVLVGEKLQVVTFKTLCREFGLVANTAKQILFEYAEKRRGDVSVMYCLSGVSKDAPHERVMLVSAEQLAAKRAALTSVSGMHVYSVQPRIPKDPSEIFSAEKAASEDEMQKLISGQETFIADNRFSAVTAHHVKRDPTAVAPPPKPKAAPAAPSQSKPAPAGGAPKPPASARETPNPPPAATDKPAAVPSKPVEAPAKAKAPPAKGSGKGSLGALWSKMPAKKATPPGAPSAAAPAERKAPVEVADSSDEEDEMELDPVQVMNQANRQRRVCMDNDEEEEGNEGGGAAQGHGGPPAGGRGRGVVLADEEDEDGEADKENGPSSEDNAGAGPGEDTSGAQGSKADGAGGSQPKKRGRKAGGKKGAAKAGEKKEEIEEAAEEEAEAEKEAEDAPRSKKAATGGIAAAFAKGKEAAPAAPAPARSGARGGKWVERTYYDDKGNEVTELVFEADAAATEAPPSHPGSQQAASQKTAASGGSPAGKTAKAAPKDPKPEGGKAGASSKNQRGIMSFFGKK